MARRILKNPGQVGGLGLWRTIPVSYAPATEHGVSLYTTAEIHPVMTDAFSHFCLTNSVRATAKRSDPNWLWMYADSTELPKASYNVRRGEFPTWTFISWPGWYFMLDTLGIKASSVELSWEAVYGSGCNIPNWESADAYVAGAGGRPLFAHIGYCPFWANRCRCKHFAPSKAVEAEVVTFDTVSKPLAHAPLFPTTDDRTSRSWLAYPFYVFPYPFETTRFEGETLSTSFIRANTDHNDYHNIVYENNQPWATGPYEAYAAPVSLGTQQVWVDNDKDGNWVEWTHTENFANSETGNTNYMMERKGRVRFPWSGLATKYGSWPKSGAAIKASFDLITSTPYVQNVDYTIDEITGVITRSVSSVTGLASDLFTGSSLEPAWSWLNEPSSPPATWAVNPPETAGCLYVDARNWILADTRYTYGAYLYQTLNADNNTDDFYTQVVIKDCPNYSGGNNQRQDFWVGLLAYKDDNNMFKYVYGWDYGRTSLFGKINGVAFERTQICPGDSMYPTPGNPLYLTVAKTGLTFGVWMKTQPGWAKPAQAGGVLGAPAGALGWCEFQHPGLTFPYKHGISIIGTMGKVGPSSYATWGASVDAYYGTTSKIAENDSVAVFYDYYYPDDWIAWVKTVVARYKDRGVWGWESWNEPGNMYVFWENGSYISAFMQNDMANAARSVDPHCEIISPGYANDAEGWMNDIYDIFGPDSIDLPSWHPYLFTNVSPDRVGSLGWQFSNFTTSNKAACIMLTKDKPGTQAVFGEVGVDGGIYSCGMGLNMRKQAEYAFRLFAMTRQLGFVRHFNWWPQYGDEQYCGSYEWSEYGPHMGLWVKHPAMGNVMSDYTWIEYIERTNNTVIIQTENYKNSLNIPAGAVIEVYNSSVSGMDGYYTVATLATLTYDGYTCNRLVYCPNSTGPNVTRVADTTGAIRYPIGYKPVFYQYKHTVNNKGIILDLVNYNVNNVEIPPSRLQEVDSIKIGTQDKSKISQIVVATSISGSDDSCILPRVPLGVTGPSWASVTKENLPAYPVPVNALHPSLGTASYRFVYQPTGDQFWAVHELIGTLGAFSNGQPFTGGVINFTIPTGPAGIGAASAYQAGDYYFTETFKGDGYVTQGVWVNDGTDVGMGDITVTLDTPVNARYVKIEFVKATGAKYFLIDEVQVLNTLGTNMASDCKYVVDGYQQYFIP